MIITGGKRGAENLFLGLGVRTVTLAYKNILVFWRQVVYRRVDSAVILAR